MSKNNFNIAEPNPGDQEFCKRLCKDLSKDPKKPLKMSEVLSLLIKNYQSQGSDQSEAIKEQIEKMNLLSEENSALSHNNFSLKNENTLLLEQIQVLKENTKEVKFPNFIVEPDDHLLKLMKRYFAFQRKKGKITQAQPPELAKQSILYFIKNETPEIL